MTPYTVIALVVALSLAQYAFLDTAAAGPRVIIVGAGMSGKQAAILHSPLPNPSSRSLPAAGWFVVS